MDHAEVASKVRKVLADVLVVDLSEVGDQADIRGDLGADSLDLSMAVVQLEDEFDIQIEDSDGDRMKTVADVVAVVKEKLQA